MVAKKPKATTAKKKPVKKAAPKMSGKLLAKGKTKAKAKKTKA